MRWSPSTVLSAALVVAVLFIAALVGGAPRESLPTLSTRSSEPTGGRALALWLTALGYRVEEIDSEPFAIDSEIAALFVLEPSVGYRPEHVEAVAQWVEAGGRLVVVGGDPEERLLERFGLRLRSTGDRQEEALPVQPLLTAAGVERVRVLAWDALVSDHGLAPWLAAADRVYVGSRPYGQGHVVVSSATYPLTNAGLATPDHAALALSLLGSTPPGARIAFDEYHHGFARAAGRSLWRLLLEHYWGWAVVYAAVVLYTYLALRGRRMGRPLVLAPAPRRSVREFVTALAALYRRAGQRGYVGARLADQLRHDVAVALGLSPGLPDAAFERAVRERRGAAAERLPALLARLRQAQRLSEAELLALVREADALAARLVRPERTGGRE